MWPKATAWSYDLREHATYLSKYLRDALLCIESAKEQPTPTPPVKTMIAAMSVMLTTIEILLITVPSCMQALTMIPNPRVYTAPNHPPR